MDKFYLPPLYFGTQPCPPTRAMLSGDALRAPVQTVVIQILLDEIPDIEVWPDVCRSDPQDEAITVQSLGSDWSRTASARQRRTRDLRIVVQAPTSDRAERLRDEVFMIIRNSKYLVLSDVDDFPGGWSDDGNFYYRGFEITLRTR